MKRIEIGLLLGVSLALFGGVAGAASPNIVIILADDLGFGDVGPGGATLIKTPHLDRMAAEGVTLTNFYSSAPVCTASRGGLLTGRYPIRLGLVQDVARPSNTIALRPEEITIAEGLKSVGYATGIFGKWHLGDRPEEWPTRQGFDYFYGVKWSNDMKPFALYRMEESIEEPVDQRTLTERYTREAIQFIEGHRDEPFFVYLPHSMPHIPLYVSDKFEGRSEAGLYGDVIETIDWSVGEIMAALKRLELDDNTLVIFTSDNGPWWEGSAGPHRDRKGSSWEGGMRVPFIARWPGTIPAGVSSDGIAMNIDMLPTLLPLAGAEIPKDRPVDGRNIMSLLKGERISPHEYLFLFNKDKIAGVRTQRWKLVTQSWYRGWNAPLGNERYWTYPGLLFDLEKDSKELYSYTRENPEVVAQLRGWLEKGQEELKDPTKEK